MAITKIRDYLSRIQVVAAQVPIGTLGKETDWLEMARLQMRGNQLWVGDTSYVPDADDATDEGPLFALEPGGYSIQVKVVNYLDADLRVSRLRVVLPDIEQETLAQIGETGTDTATIGVCDYQVFADAWGTDGEASYDKIAPMLAEVDLCGVAVLDGDTGAMMPFVSSGFGDGEFPVFEIASASGRCGIEIEFIPSDCPYPFGDN